MDAPHVYVRAWALGCFQDPQSYQYPNLSAEGADRVAGQLRGDKECPFSGVTKSGRVWRKVPESDARGVLSVYNFLRCSYRPRAQSHASASVHTGSHTIIWKILNTLIGMGSAVPAAVVPYRDTGDPNFPQGTMKYEKNTKILFYFIFLMRKEKKPEEMVLKFIPRHCLTLSSSVLACKVCV